MKNQIFLVLETHQKGPGKVSATQFMAFYYSCLRKRIWIWVLEMCLKALEMCCFTFLNTKSKIYNQGQQMPSFSQCIFPRGYQTMHVLQLHYHCLSL